MTNCTAATQSELETTCRDRAGTVVLQQELFRYWLSEAREQANARARDYGGEPRMTGFEAVPGYELRYGADLRPRPEPATEEVRQEDIYLVKDGVQVAKFTDFIVLLRSTEIDTSLSCFGSYPELFFGDE